jgi:glutamine synthetase
MDFTIDHSLLNLSYKELEIKNLEMKEKYILSKRDPHVLEKEITDYLQNEDKIKAIIVFFTDLEGKLLSLEYDKKFLVKSSKNLTFDGSSVRGFSSQDQSDLKLKIDWASFRWLPADIFGLGKAMVFADVRDQNEDVYNSDFRARLKDFCDSLHKTEGYSINIAPEIEGFLVKGMDAEQTFNSDFGFELVTKGGYYNSLPQDILRKFIDKVAEVKRALAFENEKDHPEVAPSQFELNYKYSEAIQAADQIQIYKLICRQVAKIMGLTATFLPKPIMNINGSGMHTNISISRNNENLFYGNGKNNDFASLSEFGQNFASGILFYAKDLCLIFNSSVNAYRRLDPRFEAPNEIKMSNNDRGSMIRIPLADKNAARLEIRSVAPDSNPYLTIFAAIKAGLSGTITPSIHNGILSKREKLPANIYDAIRYFKSSKFIKDIMGEEIHDKYIAIKEAVANRCPKELGNIVKKEEIIYHHEVTNQYIWYNF